MRRIVVRLPMHRKDSKSGEVKQIYANYQGTEEMVSFGDKLKNKIARSFNLKNRKDEDYQFRVFGNGQYEMCKMSLGMDKPIAIGTMMDAVVPEIIVLSE